MLECRKKITGCLGIQLLKINIPVGVALIRNFKNWLHKASFSL